MKHLFLFLSLLVASTAMAQPPTLVQHVSCPNSGALGSGVGGSQSTTPTYKCPLPELTQAGNALILGFLSNNSGTPTWTVSDDAPGGSNTWNQAVSLTDGSGNIMRVYYALNIKAGTHMLSVKASAQTTGYIAVTASEYYNVALTSALDTSQCNAGSASTSITAGSITPSTSGDLLWQWAASTTYPASVASFTAGSQSGAYWALLGTDLLFGDAVQAGIYSSTSAINPTFTSGTSEAFDSCAVALKAASAGNAPTSSFRILHVLHQAIQSGSPQTFPVQFPASGNLVVASFIAGTEQINSISSTPSNTWTGATETVDSDVVAQIYYAANASTSNGMTLSFSRSATGDGTIILYDILGAAVAPFDKDIGEQNTQHSIVSSLTTCSGCISPSGVTGGGNEIVIGNVGNSWCTATGISSPSGSVFDTATYDGNSVNGPEDVDQNNGWFHYYTSATSALTVTWNYTCGSNPQSDWGSLTAAFRSPAIYAAASCSTSDVQAAVNLASNGDIVTIPNGSCTWTSGVTTTTQAWIRALNYTPTPGGTATRNVTITNATTATGNALFNVTSGNVAHVRITGIAFDDATNCGGGACSPHINTQGSGTMVPILDDDYFQCALREGTSLLIDCTVFQSIGSVLWDDRFEGDPITGVDVSSGTFLLKPAAPAWASGSTMGTLDETSANGGNCATGNGACNIYVEDSTFYNTGCIDMDDGGRLVVRYTLMDGACLVTHGYTSTYGGRHAEFYNDTFQVSEASPGRNLADRYTWSRAGTMLLTNNTIGTVACPSCYGTPHLWEGIVECNQNSGHSTCVQPQVPEDSSGNPVPEIGSTGFYQRETGTGWASGTYVVDPVYLWDNCLSGDTLPCAGDSTWVNDSPGYIVSGTTVIVDGGAKPGYTPFPYPHPVRNGSSGSSGNNPPPPPAPATALFAKGGNSIVEGGAVIIK